MCVISNNLFPPLYMLKGVMYMLLAIVYAKGIMYMQQLCPQISEPNLPMTSTLKMQTYTCCTKSPIAQVEYGYENLLPANVLCLMSTSLLFLLVCLLV